MMSQENRRRSDVTVFERTNSNTLLFCKEFHAVAIVLKYMQGIVQVHSEGIRE